MNLVTVITQIPSPYQVEFFNAIAERKRVDLFVLYVQERDLARGWTGREIHHPHACLRSMMTSDLEDRISASSLVVFGWYQDKEILRLLQKRAALGSPWALWGERPGYSRRGILGRLYRRWRLAPLAASRAAIWGIGLWAVEGWKSEFDGGRYFANVPYFSDLARFEAPPGETHKSHDVRSVLFSGSLCARKGADLLAEAFARVAPRRPGLQLRILGDGPLRSRMEKTLSDVASRVEFLGFHDWDELPFYYQEADVLCVPSRYDGWGLVVPEGLAAGLPVIASDQTGAAIDLIENGSNGWRISANSVEALVEALDRAAGISGDELRRMSRAASRSVAGHSLAAGVERFHVAVQETIRQSPSGF